MKPQFSIIIPLYNKEHAVKSMLNSVLNQTYDNYEIIIVDDGSTDNSINIIKQCDCENLRIVDKKNGGVSSARNTGLSLAKNEWIFFLDADDEIEKNTLEIFVSLIEKCPQYKVFLGNTRLWNSYRCKVFEEEYRISTNPYKDYWYYNLAPEIGSFCFHKDVIDKIGLFNERLSFYEDLDFTSRLMDNYGVVYTSLPMRIYHTEFNVLSTTLCPITKEFAYSIDKTRVSGAFWRKMVFAYNIWDARRRRINHGDKVSSELYQRKMKELFPYYILMYFSCLSVKRYLGKVKGKIKSKFL